MSTDSSKPQDQPARSSRQSGSRLIRSTSVVGGMTLLSRILGLLRDIVLARVFGASLVMDAFLVANRIPNTLRRFFAEGAFAQGFIPVMARYRERESHDEAREYVAAMSGTLAMVLFLVTLLGVVAAPVWVLLVAPGFIGDGGDFDLAALMLKFTFPYLLFVSLTAFAGGVLNTYGRFAVPAFTPVILNVVIIAAALWWSPRLQQPGLALAYAVFVAGVIQLLFQLPFLKRIGLLPRPRWAPRHAGVRRAVKLMLPAIFGSSVAQINILLSGVIASLLGVGSISYLYYSDRLMEFPLGLFGIALATVTLPYLSRLWANEDREAFSSTLDWALKLSLLIAIPAALGLFVVSDGLVATLFFRGEFDGHAVQMTSLALKAYALGLVGFSLVKILAPAYFAREDTRTPVRIGIYALLLNLLLSVVVAWLLTRSGYPAPHIALAGATSVAALLNAALLYIGLKRIQVLAHGAGWAVFLFRLVLANAAMCAILFWLHKPLDWWLAVGFWERAGWLLTAIASAAGTYAVLLFLSGVRPATLRLKA